MLREVRWLHGAMIHAQDGEIGRVDEILFDDEQWTVRYLIVDTGNWLAGRKVLISPLAFGHLDWEHHTLNVNLTRKQVEKSPGVDTDQPVSRQWEQDYYNYYSWPYYWDGLGGWGNNLYPRDRVAEPVGVVMTVAEKADADRQEHDDAHLRSTAEVTGYGISATDGPLGHVQDFIIDDTNWRVAYITIDTRDWWPEKKVMLPSIWVGKVHWPERYVTINATRDQIKNAPEWDHTQPIDLAFMDQLAGYYARQEPNVKETQKETKETKETKPGGTTSDRSHRTEHGTATEEQTEQKTDYQAPVNIY